MPKCEQCGKEIALPFKCNYCGHYFCVEHRLPENHNCPNQPSRIPLGSWQIKKKIAYARTETEKVIGEFVSEGKYHFIRKKTEPEREKLPPHKKYARILGISVAIIVLLVGSFWGLRGLFQDVSKNQNVPEAQDIPENQNVPERSEYVYSFNFDGFSLVQNGTHLIIEDHASEWAPQYGISFENGTQLFNLVPLPVEDGIIAEYAYVSRDYTKEVFSLGEIFEELPQEYASFKFEIYTHDRQYDFILDKESQKLLFGNYARVFYLPPITFGNTVYDVVFRGFNKTAFQRIKEQVLGNYSYNDAFDVAYHLVEWADSNIEYDYFKAISVLFYIYDPLTFLEKKSGVCIDYAVFYAAGFFAAGFKEAYILIFEVGDEWHAVAGIEYNSSMLILEQHLPIMEFKDYIENSELILNAPINSPIYAFKIKCIENDFIVEFFGFNLT